MQIVRGVDMDVLSFAVIRGWHAGRAVCRLATSCEFCL